MYLEMILRKILVILLFKNYYFILLYNQVLSLMLQNIFELLYLNIAIYKAIRSEKKRH